MCISIKKDKKELLFELKGKSVIDNKKKNKTNKCVNSEKITSVDNEKIITNSKEIAKVLNVFSNILALETLKYRVMLSR